MPALTAELAQVAWGCDGTPVLLSHRENAVYAVRLPDGDQAALRIHRSGYRSPAEIEAELLFCTGLATAGVPCPRGVRTRGGDWLWQGADGAVASVVTWIEGVPLGAGGTRLSGDAPGLYRRLGAALAQMHTVADQLRLPVGIARAAWDLDGLTGRDPVWGRYWENPALSDPEARLIRQARDLARARLSDLHDGASFGMIHADPLRENVFCTQDGLALIDFDDCGLGYRAYDVAVALSQSLDDPELPQLHQAIVEGYTSLTPAEIAMLPVFSMLRCFASLAWVEPRYPAGHLKCELYKARALRTAAAVLSGDDFLRR